MGNLIFSGGREAGNRILKNLFSDTVDKRWEMWYILRNDTVPHWALYDCLRKDTEKWVS